jgi:hypothetical protein
MHATCRLTNALPPAKELLIIGWPGSLQKQKNKKSELWFLSSQPFRKKALRCTAGALCVFLPATSPAFESWSSTLSLRRGTKAARALVTASGSLKFWIS